MSDIKIGILALQGAFIEHKKMLDKIGVDNFEIRKLSDLDTKMDGLILPGGESTTVGKLLNDLNLLEPLKKMIEEGLPVFGTCCGMILLAKEIKDENRNYFGLMDAVVHRNAYGRQLGSFVTENEFKGIGNVPMVFIRGPYIEKTEENVDILSTVDGNIVAIKQKNMLATAYHPELTTNDKVHKYFINEFVKK